PEEMVHLARCPAAWRGLRPGLDPVSGADVGGDHLRFRRYRGYDRYARGHTHHRLLPGSGSAVFVAGLRFRACDAHRRVAAPPLPHDPDDWRGADDCRGYCPAQRGLGVFQALLGGAWAYFINWVRTWTVEYGATLI